MLRIGLTGGIGSGKSTVAGLFADLGVPVIDADTISHRLTQPGATATLRILESFGTPVAGPDGNLDRQRLAAHVFNNPAERQRLESILHPLIRQSMERETHALDAPYCLLVIPLLIEVGQQGLVDRVLVVDTDESLQATRVQQRDKRGAAEIQAILDSQLPRQKRRAAADDIITNHGDLAGLRKQVEALHSLYTKLATQP